MKDVEIEPEREGVWVRIHKLDSEWNTIFLYQQNNHGLIDLWFCAERSCIFYWQKPTTTWRSATLGLYANSMETSKFFLTFSWYFARALFGFFHFSSRSNCFCDFLINQNQNPKRISFTRDFEKWIIAMLATALYSHLQDSHTRICPRFTIFTGARRSTIAISRYCECSLPHFY